MEVPKSIAEAYESWLTYLSGEDWTFFRTWFVQMWDGTFTDWDLAIEVAKIPDEVWEGEDALAKVAEAIRGIEARSASEPSVSAAPPTLNQISVVLNRLRLNRDAIAASTAGLLEQLAEFRERIRGRNDIDPVFRDEILDFIDEFSQQLGTLLTELPMPGMEPDEKLATRVAIWMQGYLGVVRTKLVQYSSFENIGEASVPTAIVLVATGIGGMLGQPLAGAAVGGLIANQMKPGQAAKELLKPQNPDTD